MKYRCEFISEGWAATAAALWFVSASIRLNKPSRIRLGLDSGLDDPKALLVMVYKQSQWSAWAAVAAGLAAVFAIADGLLPGDPFGMKKAGRYLYARLQVSTLLLRGVTPLSLRYPCYATLGVRFRELRWKNSA